MNQNSDLNLLQQANRILCGDFDVNTNVDTEVDSAIKYAPITSVDVERSFSPKYHCYQFLICIMFYFSNNLNTPKVLLEHIINILSKFNMCIF